MIGWLVGLINGILRNGLFNAEIEFDTYSVRLKMPYVFKKWSNQ